MADGGVSCKNCGLLYILPEDEVVGNVPHVLVCGHIFCTVCLRSLETSCLITCPECKMCTNVDEEGVDGLQVDSRIIGLLYTAKMNTNKRLRAGVKQRARRLRSPSASPPLQQQQQQNTEVDPDVLKVLEEALCKATENYNTLDGLHHTLFTGIQAQLRKEKSRITQEIEDCIKHAVDALRRRRGTLMSELRCVEELFSSGHVECQRMEERKNELHMAIQKAKHIRQVPSLGTYCHLDKILETLRAPVDTESYDMSCLNLCSDLRCVLHMDLLNESAYNFLYMMDGKVKLVSRASLQCPPAERVCKRPVRSGRERSGDRRAGWSSVGSILKQNSPNVIVEEIIEECDSGTERERMALEPKPREKQKEQRRLGKVLQDRSSVPQAKVLQQWVLLTHVINPTHFYVQLAIENKAVQTMAKKIGRICSGERSHFTVGDQIKTGMLVFVKWKEDVWCRALVCELFQKGCLECVTQCPTLEVACLRVFFQDYGFSKGLNISSEGDLSGLHECLRKADVAARADLHRWAPLAIKCSLKDVIPSDLVKGWTTEACEEMNRVIGKSAVEMQVFGEDKDTLLVDLKKDDTLLSLRDHLVFMELARVFSPQSAAFRGMNPLRFHPPGHPKLNTKVPAVVSHVNTPSDFYIQLVDNMEFLLLNSKLQDCYGSPWNDHDLQIYCPHLNQACVALYNDSDWCRAQVTGFPGGRKVEVQYMDFGNKQALSVKDLRQIKDEFFALPAMALWCSLADVTSVGDTWSEESLQEFRELTEHKLVTVVVTKIVPQATALPVCLFEVSESFAVSYGEILVKKGLASSSKPADLKETPSLEDAVWDPPLHDVDQVDLAGEPMLSVEPSEMRLNLTLLTRVKDLRVRVTHVISPGYICVQLQQFDAQLKRIYDSLKSKYSKSDIMDVDWKVEMPCAANVNGVWERGKVCSLSTGSIAEVLRRDFGNTVKLHTCNLRPLLPELNGSLLLECFLSDIRPAGGLSTWTATACDFISYYLTGATAVMTIKDLSASPVPVSLFCCNRAGQDVSVADFLITEGLALRERCVNPSPAPKPTPVCEDLSNVSEEALLVQDKCVPTQESVCEENSVEKTPSPLRYRPPRPIPRTTPPPQKVKTQAYLPPELLPCGHTHMRVSAVSDDGVIYMMSLQAECEFERLKERMQQHIKTLPRQKHYSWRSVLGCAVMGSDMLWYRGQVLEVIGGHLKVRYVDQGIVENIPVCHVYPVVLCENVPQLCVPCQLNGVVPIGSAWQGDAVALMKELLLGRSVNVQVMELPENPRGIVTVEIILDGMALSRIMVHHQHATFDPPINSLEDYVVKPPVPDLDDWDLNTEGSEEPQTILGVYTNPQLPDEGKHFQVLIKHVRTPNEVFLSLLHPPASEPEQESLEEALQRVNGDIDALPQPTDFPIEGPCLAEYRDGLYYRAKLMGFAEINPCVKILVRHVDFGSDDILPICKLRCLPPSLLHFPCEAVYARLAGFKPPRMCEELQRISYRPEWSMKSMLEMIDLLHGTLEAVVTAVEPQMTVVLHNADGTLVHVPLVEKGLADYE